jgi:Flp pilus assembly pilin Flp
MSHALRVLGRFAREEDAPTMAEYGLMIACLSILVALSVNLLGQLCHEFFRDAAVVLNNV